MEFVSQQEDAGRRLDLYISACMQITRSAAVNLIEKQCVLVNSMVVKKNHVVKPGDIIVVDLPQPVEINVEPEDIPLDIVYEDEHIIVVNKPKGMVVHPAPGHYSGTLVNALLNHCGKSLSGINGMIRPGIVHRIDKDTSGLLIVAKTNQAHINLAEQIRTHDFLRVYNGIIYGHLREKNGTINLPIGRDPKDRKKMAVVYQNSKQAITHYRVLTEMRDSSLVEFKLETGRTHQIRVHMSYMKHAIYGDPLYSPKNIDKCVLEGQFLHAKMIGFRHPVTGEALMFDAPIPESFHNFMQAHLITEG